jgi:hypothetical protein
LKKLELLDELKTLIKFPNVTEANSPTLNKPAPTTTTTTAATMNTITMNKIDDEESKLGKKLDCMSKQEKACHAQKIMVDLLPPPHQQGSNFSTTTTTTNININTTTVTTTILPDAPTKPDSLIQEIYNLSSSPLSVHNKSQAKNQHEQDNLATKQPNNSSSESENANIESDVDYILYKAIQYIKKLQNNQNESREQAGGESTSSKKQVFLFYFIFIS